MKWFEYDPVTGVQETNATDEDTGRVIVRKEQDVEGLLERNAFMRNTAATDAGIKRGLWHYASIPLAVQYEMLTVHGVNIDNRNHWPRLQALIDSHYPYLKTTTKVHRVRGGGQVFRVEKISKPLIAH